MKSKKRVRRQVETVFEHCDACGYKGSFHVFLERVAAKGTNNVKLGLKCPSCAEEYDVGLFATLK